ncbi:hypothetical protein GN956_G8379 [Arapaima gigas]
MHQLFRLVLGQRDLSRAGDLFSLEDAEIEDSLSEALEELKAIACSPDYLTNDNDQAVVEICITRVTTAIRETRSMERHGAALVSLWESCLERSLQTVGKDEDTPHAKIASDITSCILQNYDQPPMMALAVPVAVKFLQGGNQELARNMSSYLSLASISKAELLAEHTDAIARAVLAGNHLLLRVLSSVYHIQPEVVHRHVQHLAPLLSQVEPGEQQHLLRLLQMVAKEKPLMLSSSVPLLVEHLGDPQLNDSLLMVLVGMSQASPASLSVHLPTLRAIGQRFPALLGHVAQIHGAVGLTDEAMARSSLGYLVSLLSSSEHSVHHTLLQEIRTLTDRFSSMMGGGTKDIYHMSNSFAAMGCFLGHHLDSDSAPSGRAEGDTEDTSTPCCPTSEANDREGCGTLQVNIEAFEENMGVKVGVNADDGSPQPQRRYSSSRMARNECQDTRSNRSKTLGLRAVHLRSFNSDSSPEEGDLEQGAEGSASPEPQESLTLPTQMSSEPEMGKEGEGNRRNRDWLWVHLKKNEERIRTFSEELRSHIPLPEQCVIEDSPRGGSCVAKLSFSCPLKGTYCLYSKSSFSLSSSHPHLWLQAMLLLCQSKASELLWSEDLAVQPLRAMWEQTEPKGALSFEEAITLPSFPHTKDVESLRQHLKEVRFFDVFGYNEEVQDWLCFMCNNPEKATVMNQDGQPLMEGQLKEKQVRWRIIKRWKTRYFTLAGNQLLFSRGKSVGVPPGMGVFL